MAIQNLDYWYDRQQPRFLEQLVRAFSGFQYQPGYKNGVAQSPRIVPCRYASTSRQVGYIERNMSENSLLTVPQITVFQSGLSGRREDVQNPNFIDTRFVVERKVVNGAYTGDQGNRYTVERIMPLPFQMNVQVDIWTSNLDQKYQLLEQILTVIYPTFDIQNSQNAIDWTALTTVIVEDITLSSRSVPVGNSDEIDIATITLRVPIWLSPPVKVKQQKRIEQIITNIFKGDEVTAIEGIYPEIEDGKPMAQVITTPGDLQVMVDGEEVTLKNAKGGDGDATGAALLWANVFKLYGDLRPAISTIRLYTTADPEGAFVSGSLQLDDSDPSKLLWQINPDTLPSNTQAAVNALIDPLRTLPGRDLPAPVEGVRYLILSDIGPSQAWPLLTAHANDIIQFTNGAWVVSFTAASSTMDQYVLNLHSGRQLRFSDGNWLMSIDGTYGAGYWRLAL